MIALLAERLYGRKVMGKVRLPLGLSERARMPSSRLPPAANRPPELEDFLNRHLYHPLSHKLAQWLVPTPVTPNMVSVTGAAVIVCAAVAYSEPGWPITALLGLLLHMSWHVLDGADGDLARMSGRSSPRGELVDGICDYVGHIVLYVALGSIAAQQIGTAGWALMWAAGASRIVQAAHYESLRRQYQEIVYGTPWLASRPVPGRRPGKQHPLVSYYLGLGAVAVPHARALASASAQPGTRDALRKEMIGHAPRLLGWLTLLSANYRTLAVGGAMLAGQPAWYFLFEVVLLNLVLVASWLRVRGILGRSIEAACQSDRPSTRR